MKPPQTRYAVSGNVRIAYQVVGQGPLDVVFVPGFISNLDIHWEDPGYAHLLNRFASFARLILLDKRGTGLSDRVDPSKLPSLETRMEDVHAVMDAAGSGRAALLGASEGAPMSILFAATYPQRTRALILYGGYAHFHTWVMDANALAAFIATAQTSWGTGATLRNFAPGRLNDPHFCDWWARFERLSTSPTAAIALAQMNAQIDVRHILPSIRVPTLVVNRIDDARVMPEASRYLASHIKGARHVELPGRDHPIWTGDTDRVADVIAEFLTGTRPAAHTNRVLTTLLVARLSPLRAATTTSESLFRERVSRFRESAADVVVRYDGLPIRVGAHEIGARFAGPARAVRCALALREEADASGLRTGAGIHVGEVDIGDEDVSGLAMQVTSEIASVTAPGDIAVSAVVTDLVAGSSLHFADLGDHTVVGIENPLRLLRVVDEQDLESVMRQKGSKVAALSALTTREREVLELVSEGMSNATIARRLRLSDHTVKRHVANILSKLDLPTRAAAAVFLVRHPSAPEK